MPVAQAASAGHSTPIVFPPVIPAGGFLLGVVLQLLFPLHLPFAGLRLAGGVLLVLGAAGFGWMVATMKRARTPIHNAKTPTALVETGPFRFTRNPMYLFGAIAYAGLALVLRQPWSLAIIVPVNLAMHYGVILREEQFLGAHFGAPYLAYKARVRRWL